jgi:hypothetical protein
MSMTMLFSYENNIVIAMLSNIGKHSNDDRSVTVLKFAKFGKRKSPDSKENPINQTMSIKYDNRSGPYADCLLCYYRNKLLSKGDRDGHN